MLAKGYGVRKVGEPAPVTAAIAVPHRLQYQGIHHRRRSPCWWMKARSDWDDPVTQHMPGFQIYDPYVTREMTIRDLLTHRSGLGLGEGDLMFFPPGDLGRDEIIKRLRFLKPATSFRSAYAYDNLLYLVAGQLIPAVTGKSWDDFVRERIFTPLGMTNTFTESPRSGSGEDVGHSAQHAFRQTRSAAAGGHGQQRSGGRHHHLRGGPGKVDEPAAERRQGRDQASVQRRAIPGDVVGADHPADRGAIQGCTGRLCRHAAQLPCVRSRLGSSRLSRQARWWVTPACSRATFRAPR